MSTLPSWSASEKKIARRVFDQALDGELDALLAEFKARAAAIQDPRDLWAIRDWLNARQRDIDRTYDFRYSQLTLVFAVLLREGKVGLADLQGLSQDKLDHIQAIATL